MTGVVLKVDYDSAEIRAYLKSRISKLDNLRPFYVNVGEHMLNSVQERFDTETAPDGSAWAALAPSTVAGRLRRHGNAELTILREHGHLAGSFNYEASSREVKIGSPVVYAAIHHFGGAAGRNHAAEIPARPVLGMSHQDEQAISEMAEEFLRS